jgi:DNA-directed RNA polymerase specialized sigma24 family protein
MAALRQRRPLHAHRSSDRPDGKLRIIDFAAEEAMNRPELAAVVQARQERDWAQAAAKEAAAQWRRAIRAARATGVPEAEIARAAGTTAAEVRRLSSTR